MAQFQPKIDHYKGHIFVVFLFSLFVSVSAQKNVGGRVLDAETQQPIPYVNIGVVKKGIGTVSDEEGFFKLELNAAKLGDMDEILFSALGYETVFVSFSDASRDFSLLNTIKLQPKITALEEVEVYNDGWRYVQEQIGYKNFKEPMFGYWSGRLGLGAELATKITNFGKRTLRSLEFDVVSCGSQWVKLRINIYDDDGLLSGPGSNLNASGIPVFTLITRDTKRVKVNLDNYGIEVVDRFYVSLELVELPEDQPLDLVLKATKFDSPSYRKYRSFEEWEKISPNAMAFVLETDVLVSEKRAVRLENLSEKKEAKKNKVSGYLFHKRSPVGNVEVINLVTLEKTTSDERGHFVIPADKSDVIAFNAMGYREVVKEVEKKQFININLTKE